MGQVFFFKQNLVDVSYTAEQVAKLSLGLATVLHHSRLSSNLRLLLNIIYRDGCKRIWVTHDLDLSGSCDIISHTTIRFPVGHFQFASSDSFSVRRYVRQTDEGNTVA